MKNVLFSLIAFSLLVTSCVDDPEPICKTDPRAAFVGDYAMEDSVFFLGSFSEIREYTLRLEIDTVAGDTVILENIFNTDFGLDLVAIMNGSDFNIPSQEDGSTTVSGSGFIAGDLLEYTAAYADGGYSFKGVGVKN